MYPRKVIRMDAIVKALESKIIAVVGLSKDPSKPSYDVASYLLSKGYRIVPVNPTASGILGEKCYKSLMDLPVELKRELDVVVVFRRSEDVLPVVEETIQLRSKYGRPNIVWMQLGIVNDAAAKLALEAGLGVVMDRCMKIEHARMRV
ncbi:MAG: CoA-binding protein [Candidatus Bathyarchaeia archaeon]|jgi:predicted CoA-binding protein